MDEKARAFVIMPFDVEFESIFEMLIKEPLEDAGYQVAKADSFLDQQNILSDIIRGITTADLVVADLTTNNPNVFYELGLCHGLRIPTVLIAQALSDVPFDLRSYKVLIYETHFNRIKKLKSLLKDIGTKHKNKEITFGSPVIDFSATKSTDISIKDAAEKVTVQEEHSEVVDEKEFLDYLADAEISSLKLTSILAKLLKDNEIITNRINKHAASMQALTNNPTAGSAGKYHKISLLAASDMNNFSMKVEDALPTFEETIDSIRDNYLGFIAIVDPQSQDRDGINAFRKSIEDLLLNSSGATTGMCSFRDAVKELSEKRISKDISRAGRRQAEALNGIISNLQRVEAFCVKALAMMDDKFSYEL